MGDLLALQWECGYRADHLVSGGVMAGVIDLFICADCRDIISAQTWSVGYRSDHPQGEVAPTCPRCGGDTLQAWGEGAPLAGPCPHCGRRVQTESVGIAD